MKCARLQPTHCILFRALETYNHRGIGAVQSLIWQDPAPQKLMRSTSLLLLVQKLQLSPFNTREAPCIFNQRCSQGKAGCHLPGGGETSCG